MLSTAWCIFIHISSCRVVLKELYFCSLPFYKCIQSPLLCSLHIYHSFHRNFKNFNIHTAPLYTLTLSQSSSRIADNVTGNLVHCCYAFLLPPTHLPLVPVLYSLNRRCRVITKRRRAFQSAKVDERGILRVCIYTCGDERFLLLFFPNNNGDE